MHPEIKKLIDLAFTSGEFTDAKKQIILKKAESLGLDSFFIEMEIENKLSNSKSNNHTTQSEENEQYIGIIDIEYYPFFELPEGFTEEIINQDIRFFKNFFASELGVQIQNEEHQLEMYRGYPHEDDTCLIRLYVNFGTEMNSLAKTHKLKLEAFSNCPWTDDRENGVLVYLASYPKIFLHELNMSKSIDSFHRAKESLITVSEGHLY